VQAAARGARSLAHAPDYRLRVRMPDPLLLISRTV
jgi:hypothetical protein